MKTIHIKGYTHKEGIVLIHKIYDMFLSKDKNWHFFYEPDLIIRIKDKKIIKRIKKYLNEQDIEYIIYSYPNVSGKYYGEDKEKFHRSILSELLNIYHIHSKLSMKMNNKEKKWYINRVIHCMFNVQGLNYEEEAKQSIKHGLSYLNISVEG